MDDAEPDLREQIFHDNVRENIIFLLLFIGLYLLSFMIINKYFGDGNKEYTNAEKDEKWVYRICLWLCTFSFAVTLGSTLLLPVSIISNEVLLLYPNSYYVEWLNSSLIQGIWHYVFSFSNLSLFVILPFAYFFLESSGFRSSSRGLWGRVFETFTVMALLAMVMLGFACVISAFLDGTPFSMETLLKKTSLAFLYSCVSFVGVLMLLLLTPLGFVRLFGVVGGVLVKPQFLRDLDEEYYMYSFEEDTTKRRMENAIASDICYISPEPVCCDGGEPLSPVLRLRNGALQLELMKRLQVLAAKRKELEGKRKTSSILRNVVYPAAMLLLLAVTVVTLVIVVLNMLELLIGTKAPLSTTQFTLGISSMSKLGWVGATLEAFLILYLHAASLTGLWALRLLPASASPSPHSPSSPSSSSAPSPSPAPAPAPAPHSPAMLVLACAVLLLHSSAQPLLIKILGITNFDLLGEFGRIEWLGNLTLVLMYNVVFVAATTLCIVNKFTANVRRELYNRFKWIPDLLSPIEVPVTSKNLRPSTERTISSESFSDSSPMNTAIEQS